MNPALAVVDASVVAKWLLPEPGRGAALHLLDSYEAAEVVLIAPDLLTLEIASVLCRRIRRKYLNQSEAHRIFALFKLLQPRLVPANTLLDEAFALAASRHISLWDCLYLVLAVQNNCELITADRRFSRAVGSVHAQVRFLG